MSLIPRESEWPLIMLTKNIYNGFRVTCSFEDVHALFTEYGELVNELAFEDAHEKYAQLIVEDEIAIACTNMGTFVPSPLKNFKKDGLSVISAAYYRLSDAEDKIKKNPDVLPEYNYSCKVTFIPDEDGFLIAVDTKHKPYLDLLYSNENIERYEYWMDRPRPASVTEEEWTERGERWSKLFASADTETGGYTRQLYAGLANIKPKKLLDLLNTKYTRERRLELLSRNFIFAELKREEEHKDKDADTLYKEMMASKDQVARMQGVRMLGDAFLYDSYTPEYLLRK